MKYCLFGLLAVVILSCGKDSNLSEEVLSPSPANLIFPENNSICITGTVLSATESEVLFEWTESENTDTYQLILTNLNNGVAEEFESDLNRLSIRLVRGVPYSWLVTSIKVSNNSSTESEVSSFYNAGPGLTSYVPFPATAISPLDNAELGPSSTTVMLQWETSDLDNDVVEYDVYFGTDTNPNLSSEGLVNNSLEVSNLELGTIYFWRIISRDSLGNESSSAVFSFEILN